MVAMAALQVFIVKMFFTGGRKGKSLAVALCYSMVSTLTVTRLRVNDYIASRRRLGVVTGDEIG